MSRIRWAKLLEDNPLVVIHRLIANPTQQLARADLSSITYRVWKYDTYEDCVLDRNGTEVGVQASLTVADVIFDAYQTDAWWQDENGQAIDATGYNFRATIPAARFPDASKWSRVEVTFTPASGEPYKIVHGASTVAVATS